MPPLRDKWRLPSCWEASFKERRTAPETVLDAALDAEPLALTISRSNGMVREFSQPAGGVEDGTISRVTACAAAEAAKPSRAREPREHRIVSWRVVAKNASTRGREMQAIMVKLRGGRHDDGST